MDSLVADSQSWPTSLKKLYLKQLTASVSPLMLTMPSTLQVLSISNVASFSAQYFTDTFAQVYGSSALPTLTSLSLILMQFDMNVPEVTQGLLKVLRCHAATLKELDLSGNLLQDNLVREIANKSGLRLTRLTLLNLKSPNQFKFYDNVVLLGSQLAPIDRAIEIRLSYYQLSSSGAFSPEGGEGKLSKALEGNPRMNCCVKLV